MVEKSPLKSTNSQTANANQPQEMTLRRSQRTMRLALSNDYVMYLQESNFDIGIDKNPISFDKP